MQNTYEYYSSLPLTLTILQIERIKKFMEENEDNIVLVHCQENMTRSVVFLASFLYLSGSEEDIASALAMVNDLLALKQNSTIFASQHNILRNVAHFHKDPTCINSEYLKLIKVIINQAPTIPEIPYKEEEPLKALL